MEDNAHESGEPIEGELVDDSPKPAVQVQNFPSIHLEGHSGPLPSPEQLAKYDQVVPGLAKTIVEWADSERKQRYKETDKSLALAEKQIDKNDSQMKLGIGSSVGITAFTLVFAVLFGYQGNTPLALGFLGTTFLTGIAGVIRAIKDRPETENQNRDQGNE